jgi:hypothetical protein
MLSITRQAALRGTRSLLHSSRAYATSEAPPLRKQLAHSDERSEIGVLKRGGKRDPELYVRRSIGRSYDSNTNGQILYALTARIPSDILYVISK